MILHPPPPSQTSHYYPLDPTGLVSVCQCSAFLDPYPSGQSAAWRNMVGSSALQHYCRVCNTQLNSCKQARIHCTGKKHEKRLAYLKFSLETSEAVTNNFAGQFVPAAPVGGSGPVYAFPPPCGGYPPQPAPPAYYFPPTYQTQHPLYHYDQQQPAPAPPPVSSSSSHPPHPPCTARRGKVSVTTGASHGVMSPSLTSGFSGSGDCKSTETCSLLSVASYSSATPNTATKESSRSTESSSSSNPIPSTARHVVNCEVCHLPFPSRAVLEHHLMGSRHARKVKAESVLRQLQENGAEFRATLATGDIRCEVCEVSVNSSHQLQAHMTGHKHKMRCQRQGVAPNKTILTPTSSTAPSSTPSEASAPVRSQSILVGRPQFGSRPNLYKHLGHSGHRGIRDKISKTRKTLRPRPRLESGCRNNRGAGKEKKEALNQTDSTESDEPAAAVTKQKPPPSSESDKKEEDHQHHQQDEDTDTEAKESEADLESVKPSTESGGKEARSRFICTNQIAKASQTEPLRRLSVDLEESHSSNPELVEDSTEEKEENQEPRRRSVSASYGAVSSSSSYHCNLCQITVNSQSQLAQHTASNKHRRLSLALQTNRVPAGSKDSLAERTDCNYREIPMLSMFLQRLHQHHYFPPIRDEEENGGETHR